jgi:hypothetical protein
LVSIPVDELVFARKFITSRFDGSPVPSETLIHASEAAAHNENEESEHDEFGA